MKSKLLSCTINSQILLQIICALLYYLCFPQNMICSSMRKKHPTVCIWRNEIDFQVLHWSPYSPTYVQTSAHYLKPRPIQLWTTLERFFVDKRTQWLQLLEDSILLPVIQAQGFFLYVISFLSLNVRHFRLFIHTQEYRVLTYK